MKRLVVSRKDGVVRLMYYGMASKPHYGILQIEFTNSTRVLKLRWNLLQNANAYDLKLGHGGSLSFLSTSYFL